MKCLRYNKRIIETVLCLGFILLGLVFLESQPVWGQASFILAFFCLLYTSPSPRDS